MAHTRRGGGGDEPRLEAWERQRRETAKAYAAFRCYRDLGPTRSLAQAAAALGRHVSLLKRWSARHEWGRRALAWDGEQAREEQRIRREQRQRALEQQAQDAELLRKLCRAFLQGLVRRDPETGELELDGSVKPRDAVQFYRLAGDIDKSLPPPEESQSDDGGSDPLAAMSDAELRRVLAALELDGESPEGGAEDGTG